jgi:hypothetical protein
MGANAAHTRSGTYRSAPAGPRKEMTKSLRAKLVGRVREMVLLLSLGIPTAFAQQNPPVSQETVLTFVHDFLEVFYPDLLSNG